MRVLRSRRIYATEKSLLNVPAAIVRSRHASIVAKLFERLTALRISSNPSRQIASCDAASAWSSIRTVPRERALKNLAK